MLRRTWTSCWLVINPIWLESVLFPQSKERSLRTVLALSFSKHPPKPLAMLNRPSLPWPVKSRPEWRPSPLQLEQQEARAEFPSEARPSSKTRDAAKRAQFSSTSSQEDRTTSEQKVFKACFSTGWMMGRIIAFISFPPFFNSLSECYGLLVVGSSCVKSAWQQLIYYYDIILIGASTEIFYLYIFRSRFGFDLFV